AEGGIAPDGAADAECDHDPGRIVSDDVPAIDPVLRGLDPNAGARISERAGPVRVGPDEVPLYPVPAPQDLDSLTRAGDSEGAVAGDQVALARSGPPDQAPLRSDSDPPLGIPQGHRTPRVGADVVPLNDGLGPCVT